MWQFKIDVYLVLVCFLTENVPADVGFLDHISIWGGGGGGWVDFIVTQISLVYLISAILYRYSAAAFYSPITVVQPLWYTVNVLKLEN